MEVNGQGGLIIRESICSYQLPLGSIPTNGFWMPVERVALSGGTQSFAEALNIEAFATAGIMGLVLAGQCHSRYVLCHIYLCHLPVQLIAQSLLHIAPSLR